MFQLAVEGEAGLLIVAVGMTILVYQKFIRSGIPRIRVILLCILCSVMWIMSFILSFLDTDPAHSLLWETMSLLA